MLTSGSRTVSGVWSSAATETPGHFPAEQEAGAQPWQEGLSGLDLWVSWDLSQFLFQLPLLSKKHQLSLTAHAGDLLILFDIVHTFSSHPQSMSSPSLPVPRLSCLSLPALGRLGPKPLPRCSSPVIPLANPLGPCSSFLSAPSSKSGLLTFLHSPPRLLLHSGCPIWGDTCI